MNKMGEKHSREEKSIRDYFYKKKIIVGVITCLKLDMSFGL